MQSDVDRALRIARVYRKRQAPRAERSDVESAALEGLAQAASKYRPEVGDFWTYAIRRVIGAIRDDLRRVDYLTRTQRRGVHLTDQGTLEWDDPEAFALAAPTPPVAFEGLALDDLEGDRFGTVDPGYEEFDLRDALDQALADLPQRERFIVTSVDLEGFTEKSVGELLGVTEGRVSQLRTQAFLRLRNALRPVPTHAPPLAARESLRSARLGGRSPSPGLRLEPEG